MQAYTHIVCRFRDKKYGPSHDDNNDNLNRDNVTLELPVHVINLLPSHVFSERTHQNFEFTEDIRIKSKKVVQLAKNVFFFFLDECRIRVTRYILVL